jgi:ketosteroid isomerase-like protein
MSVSLCLEESHDYLRSSQKISTLSYLAVPTWDKDARMAGAAVQKWLAAYERLWRSAGAAGLKQLFTEDATYQPSPYDPPVRGLSAIAKMWEAEREGPDESFTMSSRVIATENETAVVRVDVTYGDPITTEYRDLWIIRFDVDGRCEAFEEWPFWPGQARTPSGSS